LAETTYDSFHKRDKNPRYAGILVPVEDGEKIAALAERMIRGEIRVSGFQGDEVIDNKTGQGLKS
jgi:hypothetical protein